MDLRRDSTSPRLRLRFSTRLLTTRHITLHLPRNWPWQHVWTHMFAITHGPPELI
jgi:hypothetical protein